MSEVTISKIYEGVVNGVGDDEFTARLIDMSSNREYQALIPKENVDEEDRDLIEAGNVFYWVLGEDADAFVFLEPRPFSAEEIKQAKEKAQELKEQINFE